MPYDWRVKATVNALANGVGIGTNKSQTTLHLTTQRGVRSSIFPISISYMSYRMYQTNIFNSKFAICTLFLPTNPIS